MKEMYKRFWTGCIVFLIATMQVSANLLYDQKLLLTGLVTNVEAPQISENPNFRLIKGVPLSMLGQIVTPDDRALEIESKLNAKNFGNKVMKELIGMSNGHPSLEQLYEIALRNVTLEESELAEKDVSAEKEAYLKDMISRQLLKNNYILYVGRFVSRDKNGQIEYDKNGRKLFQNRWIVYSIDINDETIEQIFLNWNKPTLLSLINIPVKYVAQGEIDYDISWNKYSERNEIVKINNKYRLVYDISKKVPAFAIRGPLIANHPLTARVNSIQCARTGDNVSIYRVYEGKSGNLYSKRRSRGKIMKVDNTRSTIKKISGKSTSYKNGDIAVVDGHGGSSISIMGEYSLGSDSRVGGRLQYDWLFHYSQGGFSNSLLLACGYRQYKKEPDKIWSTLPVGISDSPEYLRPTLKSMDVQIGYGLGTAFLGKFEIQGYTLLGFDYIYYSGLKDGGGIWDSESQEWKILSNGPNPDGETKAPGFELTCGLRLSMNICYPLQVFIGTSYNLIGVPVNNDNAIKIALDCHKMNRVNLNAGIKFNF